MKVIYKYFLSLFFSLFLIVGCKTTTKVTKPESNVSIVTEGKNEGLTYVPWTNSLLWKVESSNLDISPSYIFGTIHIIDSDKFFYPERTLEVLEECGEVFFEIDMDEMNNVGSQMGMMGKLFMKDGVTLDDLMSEEDFTLVSDFFNTKGLPMMFVNKIKPMFLASMTEMDLESMGMFGKGNSESNVKSYEMELYEEANGNNLEVSGLETMEFQIDLFDAIPYDAQAEMLVQAVKDSGSEEASKMMDELVKVYISQNIEGLVNTIQEDDSMAKYEQMLLTDRNKNWIPIIESEVASQPTFIAVGAGHLAGPNGVLNLLKQKGYSLTPMSKTDD